MVCCPSDTAAALENLRTNLRANPLYASIPSFAGSKAFHAKDDHPEIRSKVFDLLVGLDFKFYAIVKDMRVVRDYVRRRNGMDAAYRYHPNELYDLAVRMLFKHRLHKADFYRIIFARRGKSDRTAALCEELQKTRAEFLAEHPESSTQVSLDVVPSYPHEQPCLQIADYALWALQRCYERYEVRFLQALWPKVSLIPDVDDNVRSKYGSYLTRQGPCPDPGKIKDRRI